MSSTLAALAAAFLVALALVVSPLTSASASASTGRSPEASVTDAGTRAGIPWDRPFTCDVTGICSRYMKSDYCGSSRAPAVVTWGAVGVYVKQYDISGALLESYDYDNGSTPNTRTSVLAAESSKIRVDYRGAEFKTPRLTCVGPW